MTPIRPEQPPRFPATPFPGATQPPFLPNVHDPLRYVRRGVFDGVVKSLGRDLATLSQGLSDAMEVAESAESQAVAAGQAADDAASTASAASTAASEAKTVADGAQSTASEAKTVADGAQSTASSNAQDISVINDQLASFPYTYATKSSVAPEYFTITVDSPGSSSTLALPTGPTHRAVYEWRNTSAGEYELHEFMFPDLPVKAPDFLYELDLFGHSAASTTAMSVYSTGVAFLAFADGAYHDFYLGDYNIFHLHAVSSYTRDRPYWLIDVRTFS